MESVGLNRLIVLLLCRPLVGGSAKAIEGSQRTLDCLTGSYTCKISHPVFRPYSNGALSIAV